MTNDSIMYTQLQPWSTAGAPPCLEQISGPPIPTRTGIYYNVSKKVRMNSIHLNEFIS